MKTYRTMVRAVFEVYADAKDQQEAERVFNHILLRTDWFPVQPTRIQIEVTELQHGLIINQVRSAGPVRCQHGTVDPV